MLEGEHDGLFYDVQNASFKQKLLEEVAGEQGITSDDLSARQICQLLKNKNGEEVCPTPYKCHLNAPGEINVFTDGSWPHTVKQFLGIGGAGVWWPNRAMLKENDNSNPALIYSGLSQAEEVPSHRKQE